MELKTVGTSLRQAKTALEAKDEKAFVDGLLNFEGALAEILSKVHQSFKKAYESQKEPKARVAKPIESAKPEKTKAEEPQQPPEQPPAVEEVVADEKKEPQKLAEEPKVIVEDGYEAKGQIEEEPYDSYIVETQPEPEKGWWTRLKEKGKNLKESIFNKDTGKALGKMSYDTITSVLGVKLATDLVYGLATGKGDLAEWWKGRKESKGSREAITETYQSLMQSFKKIKRNEALAESEKIETRLADFKTKIESARISSEAKKELSDRLLTIGEKHQEDTETAAKERDKEVRRVLEAYVQGKISGMKIAKDGLNLALTATGLLMLRGAVYAGVSKAEGVEKAKREYAKQTLGTDAKKAELKFVAKDVIINAAIETAHGLSLGVFSKEKIGVKRRTLNFIKEIGTVARGFGIYGLAFSHAELPGQSIDKLISQIKEHGVAGAISDNFIHNVERVAHLYTHPTEAFTRHKGPVAPRPEEYREIPDHPVPEPLHTLEPPVSASLEPDSEAAPIPEGPHKIDVVILKDWEGVDHGFNKLIRAHPELFRHENGAPWSADEFHKFRVKELQNMGVKFEGSVRGDPFTEHEGAQVELFTDKNGNPHFKFASDEHITWNKNYKWVDTEPAKNAPTEELVSVEKETLKIVDTGAIAGRKGDYLINPFPDDHEINHAQTANADVVVEQPVAHKQMKVDVEIRERAVVHHAPAAAPEVAAGKETVGQFLTERGSSPKEFVAVYDKMVDATIEKLNNSFVFRGNSENILQAKIDFLYNGQNGITFANLSNPNLTGSDSLKIVEKVWDAEERFKFHQPDWTRDFRLALFDKSDKVAGLALAPDRDVQLNPFMTNDGHAARIWDPVEGKDIFIYDKDRIFKTGIDGKLVVEDEYGVTRTFTHKSAIKMSEKL